MVVGVVGGSSKSKSEHARTVADACLLVCCLIARAVSDDFKGSGLEQGERS